VIRMSAQRRREAIAAGVVSAYARDQVRKALYEVILSGLDCGPCALPAAEDREWIRGAIGRPLEDTTEIALATLRSAVRQALEQAPDGLLDRLQRNHQLVALGIE
jgi:hypothetical protein